MIKSKKERLLSIAEIVAIKISIVVIFTAALFSLFFASISFSAETAKASSDAPDIDVTYIERTPRYAAGPWAYPATGPQYLGVGEHIFTDAELNGERRQNPNPGEEVTFTAHISNKSAVASLECSFEWIIDGKKVFSGKLPAIQPWKETT